MLPSANLPNTPLTLLSEHWQSLLNANKSKSGEKGKKGRWSGRCWGSLSQMCLSLCLPIHAIQNKWFWRSVKISTWITFCGIWRHAQQLGWPSIVKSFAFCLDFVFRRRGKIFPLYIFPPWVKNFSSDGNVLSTFSIEEGKRISHAALSLFLCSQLLFLMALFCSLVNAVDCVEWQ